ncbi:MAG: mannose-6-phosphate isomerase, class I [Treponema sp.]|jgi:mannose-6-phosphate isomerase|nr:mannose-6-phosphate isomerase, class I [Treponema sp.]
MADIYKLTNKIQHYDWGSPDAIPRLLGIQNKDALPWAEMWMGTHPLAPSLIDVNGKKLNLEQIAGSLPYLFKLIAADKPLSIQAHPNLIQAREGFERENRAGIALDDPARNYKDANHKPEILCALTPFTVMAGFRPPVKILGHLEALLTVFPSLRTGLVSLLNALSINTRVQGSQTENCIGVFLHALFSLPEQTCQSLSHFLSREQDEYNVNVITRQQWRLMREFALLYPGDPAVISPLYLNVMMLEAGQAFYIPAGILHAYINGFGVELMAASDNVLRGGLTPKHIDINELVNIIELKTFLPEIITPEYSSSWFSYNTPCGDFTLSFMSLHSDKKTFHGKNSICIISEGELTVNGIHFKKGESFFIPRGADTIFKGDFFSYIASCNQTLQAQEKESASIKIAEKKV